MKKTALAVLTAALLLAACGCARQAQSGACYALGTVCSVSVYGENGLAEEGEQRLNAIDARWSWRNSESEVAGINANSGSFVPVSRETYALIALAKSVAERSQGAFDPTIGIVAKLWDFAESPHKPADVEIAAALPYVGYAGIQLDEEACAVKIDEGQFLDLGGIAKGAAANELRDMYRARGVQSGLLNLGGNIMTIGKKPGGEAYRIGLRDPRGGEESWFCTVAAENMAVVTSGTYERSFIEDGVMYHHILDTKTGRPVNSGLLSACIIAEDSALADALSTAVFVLGEENGIALAESYAGVYAALVTDDGRIVTSRGFEDACLPVWNEEAGYTR